ncbi:MAG: hypothetical protein H0U59_02460 [Gemmatimonadaceae bacterium]|nr:hypothetical protein [Gemmatimonadaceae bacterium]
MSAKPARFMSEDAIIITLGVTWLVLYLGIRFFLEANPGLDDGLRLGLAFVPTPVFALFLWRFVKGIRAADELERRIQLEALAVAFPLGLLLLTTLGLVQRAVELNFQDWSYNHIWPYFWFFYLLGLWIARKRYT